MLSLLKRRHTTAVFFCWATHLSASFSTAGAFSTGPFLRTTTTTTTRILSSSSSSPKSQQTMALSTNLASSATSPDSPTVNLMELAAAAIACTVSASREILKLTEPNNDKNTRTKEDGSFVTDADLAAQYVIVQALRTVSHRVQIVGEESQEEMESIKGDYDFLDPEILLRTKQELAIRRKGRTTGVEIIAEQEKSQVLPLSSKKNMDSSSMKNDFSDISTLFQDDPSVVVDASRVCVIVDPLDGTKSYTHGEYDAVSILIAIILDNKPYFGVIGKPFGYFTQPTILDTNCVTIYGGPLIGGVFVAGDKQVIPQPIASMTHGAPVSLEDLPRAVISSSRSKGVVQDFCLHLGEKGLVYPEPLLISGAGEKSLRLILQQKNEAVWFYPKPGTSLWDVAAPDALLRSLGGKLTDKFGKEMNYCKSREEFENIDGVVACIDEGLHAQCIQLFSEGEWLSQR